MSANPLNKIIYLSVTLALGFLLLVLASTLYANWYPLLTSILFTTAYIPILFTSPSSSNSFYNDLLSESSGGFDDFNRWLCGVLLFSGISSPFMLKHCNLLTRVGLVMTEIGGLLIFGTIAVFCNYFTSDED